MKIKKLTVLFISMLMLFVYAEPVVSADDSYDGSYVKTFVISAYYSPLPCQNHYVTGSYEGDIRLNGGGVHGADGSPVFPGMIAAPKTYQFGTKMHIPGLGIGSVHDRGGAIVVAGQRNQSYDRLDIWMGYGDAGLTRALNWGKRTVDVLVYGVNDSIADALTFGGYDPSEATVADCSAPTETAEPEVKLASEVEKVEPVVQAPAAVSDLLAADLNKGDSGDSVVRLQRELKKLNYYRSEPSGVYDDVTAHAVFKFQQSQSLVSDRASLGAGVAGPKTRDRLNEIIASRTYVAGLIAAKSPKENVVATRVAFSRELQFGVYDPDVVNLQSFLREKGYFNYDSTTDFYGPVTEDAVYRFQVDNGIVKGKNDLGAGRVGQATLKLINSLI